MMGRHFGLLGLIALVLLGVRPAHAQEEAPGARIAPYLGPETYTVHVAGTLEDAIRELQKQTQRFIGWPQGVKMDQPVVLDLDNARLDTILLAVCEQAGLTYDAQAGGRQIMLLKGDLKLDCRPTADLGDYVVRVTGVTTESRSSLTFRWGLGKPEDPTTYVGLQVSVLVTAKTQEAYLHLAGLQSVAKATADTGEVLQTQLNLPPDWLPPSFEPAWGSFPPRSFGAALNLPLAPEKARELTRLEGAVRLYSEAALVELHLKPGEAGTPVKQDPMTAVVKSWQQIGAGLRICLEVTSPPRPPTPNDNPFGTGPFSAVLIGKDGKPWGALTHSSSTTGPALSRFELNFANQPAGPGANPPADVDYLSLRFLRLGPADKTVPFVIENIALP